MDTLKGLNKESQELLELFTGQLEVLSSRGDEKVVVAFITLGHLMGKEVQILREENKLLLKSLGTMHTAHGPISWTPEPTLEKHKA